MVAVQQKLAPKLGGHAVRLVNADLDHGRDFNAAEKAS
jgi:hypothetical protein